MDVRIDNKIRFNRTIYRGGLNVGCIYNILNINYIQFAIHKLKLSTAGGVFYDIPPDFLLFWTNLTACGPEGYENNYLSLHKKST